MTAPTLPALLQAFFTQRRMHQRQASAHTIASYRDSFRLLFRFAQQRLGRAPQRLAFEQIDAPLIVAFLDDLQAHRGSGASSRNLRLTAIRSFFRYASYEMPACAAQIQRVLAIPSKRCTRAQIGFLTREEVDALLRAPDLRTRAGRRDHALMLLAAQTGLRLSELTGLRRDAVHLGNLRLTPTRARRRLSGMHGATRGAADIGNIGQPSNKAKRPESPVPKGFARNAALAALGSSAS